MKNTKYQLEIKIQLTLNEVHNYKETELATVEVEHTATSTAKPTLKTLLDLLLENARQDLSAQLSKPVEEEEEPIVEPYPPIHTAQDF